MNVVGSDGRCSLSGAEKDKTLPAVSETTEQQTAAWLLARSRGRNEAMTPAQMDGAVEEVT